MTAWLPGVHLAAITCPSCRGRGFIGGKACMVCHGAGRREAGCGGQAELHPTEKTLANCIAEDRLVPPDEVTLAK